MIGALLNLIPRMCEGQAFWLHCSLMPVVAPVQSSSLTVDGVKTGFVCDASAYVDLDFAVMPDAQKSAIAHSAYLAAKLNSAAERRNSRRSVSAMGRGR